MQTMTQRAFFEQCKCPLTEEQLSAHMEGKSVAPTEEQIKFLAVGLSQYNLTDPVIKVAGFVQK